MTGQSDILLEGRGLAADRGGRRVYEGLDVTVHPGELLVLRGANGSGKSSLFALLLGERLAGLST